jgi:hypothetical protein
LPTNSGFPIRRSNCASPRPRRSSASSGGMTRRACSSPGRAGVALFADRLWPLIVAGLQADAVIIHVCKLIQPDMLPLGYAIGLSIWSYPILVVLAIGTARHRRRLAARGRDPAWSAGRVPAGRAVETEGCGGTLPPDRSRRGMPEQSPGGS